MRSDDRCSSSVALVFSRLVRSEPRLASPLVADESITVVIIIHYVCVDYGWELMKLLLLRSSQSLVRSSDRLSLRAVPRKDVTIVAAVFVANQKRLPTC